MIRHIVAFDRRRGIAKDGVQPWKLPADEQYFADQTKRYGGIVLMGRTTFEVIGRPLPDRDNFILTRDMNYQALGAKVVHDIDDFLDTHPEAWIIGGAKVYEATLARADELLITEIDADYGCDTFYPAYEDGFEAVQTGEWQIENDTRFRYVTYRPKKQML